MNRLSPRPAAMPSAPVPAAVRSATTRLPRIADTGYGTSQGYVRLRCTPPASMPSRFRIA